MVGQSYNTCAIRAHPNSHEIFMQYCDVTLARDILQVNRTPFFIMISHHIRFATSEMITDQKATTLLN